MLIASLTFTGVARGESWVSIGGGLTGNAFSATFPGGDLTTRWTSALGSGGVVRCVVADESRVYVVRQDADDSSIARLFALDRVSGAVAWQSPDYPGGNGNCPAVGSSVVVVGGGSGLKAFSAVTGAGMWSVSTYLAGPVTISNDTIYGSAPELPSCPSGWPDHGSHAAWNLADGSLKWCVPGSQTELPPLVVPGAVIQGRRSSPGLVAMDPSNDGATLWSDDQAEGRYVSVARGNSVAFMVTGNYPSAVRARNATTGAQLWQYTLPNGQHGDAVAMDDERVYVAASTASNCRVHAINLASGTAAWSAPVVVPRCEGIAVLGSRVVVNDAAIDAATGVATLSPYTYDYASTLTYRGNATADGDVFSRVDVGGGVFEVQAKSDLTPPELSGVSPADTLLTTDTTPTFKFATTDGLGTGVSALSFELDGVARDVLGASQFTPAVALADGVHAWSIRATDAAGNSSHATARSITIDTTPPTAFTIIAPTAGATVSDDRPRVAWKPSSDATAGLDHYDLRLDGVNKRIDPTCQQDCSATPDLAQLDGRHEVEVIAVDKAGHQRSSGSRDFVVASPPLASLSTPSLVVQTGRPVALDASGSSDNDRIDRYEWDPEGDGSFEPAAGASRTVTFANPGPSTVAVRVTDGAGLTATATVSVDVRRAAPSGDLGVSINDGAIATNDPAVTISTVWPHLAHQTRISNDGGFGTAGATRSVLVAPAIPWRLSSSGPERLPKTVYVKFNGGDSGRETYTDDIILDETAPKTRSATLLRTGSAATARTSAAKRRKVRIRIKATDNAAGVTGIQVVTNRRKPGKIIRIRRARKVKRIVSARVARGRVSVRVIDNAGNHSAWRIARRS